MVVGYVARCFFAFALPVPALAAAVQAEAAVAATRPAHNPEALKADLGFFTDASCSELKPSVRRGDLAGFKSDLLKEVAAAILSGTYDKTCRAAGYEAYPSPRELSETLKLGEGFSRYENITGMCLDAGEHVVLVGDTGGKGISLLIPDWMRKPPEGVEPTKDPAGWGLHKQEIKLQEGVNIVHVKKGGNAYVSYFDDHAEKAPRIRVHFPTGKVNGFFDITRHTNADWNRLLDHAVSPVLDARGRCLATSFKLKSSRRFCLRLEPGIPGPFPTSRPTGTISVD